MRTTELIDIKWKNTYDWSLEVDRFWWASWTSNPVTGRDVRGGFDSHAHSPFFLDIIGFLPLFLVPDPFQAEVV